MDTIPETLSKSATRLLLIMYLAEEKNTPDFTDTIKQKIPVRKNNARVRPKIFYKPISKIL